MWQHASNGADFRRESRHRPGQPRQDTRRTVYDRVGASRAGGFGFVTIGTGNRSYAIVLFSEHIPTVFYRKPIR